MAAPNKQPDLAFTPPAVWAGVECSRLRIGNREIDQLVLTGHDRRMGDMELLASLGVTAARYPVLWERVEHVQGAYDWSWSDERLGALRHLRIEPVVGLLHHGQGPHDRTLLKPGFVEAFASYAAAVARRYPWVTQWLPINEPLTTARFGGLYGWWPPYRRSDATFARLLVTQILAVRAAMRSIRAVNDRAQLIVNEDVGRTFSTRPIADDCAFLNQRRWLTWDLLLGHVTREHSMYDRLAQSPQLVRALADLADDPSPPDLLGVDHYVTSDRFLDHRVQMYVPERRDPLCPAYVDVEAARVRGVPSGSAERAIRDTWRRYRRPMALTEISLAGEPHDQVAWWNEAWSAAVLTRRTGMDVRAVTAWSAFGATDWHCLMRRPDNVYAPGAFDASFDPPLRRPVADAIAASAGRPVRRSTRSRHETGAPHAGWWTSPSRFSLTL